MKKLIALVLALVLVLALAACGGETDNPSTEDPGTNEPSTNDPGTNEPSTNEPATTEPGDGEEWVEPVEERRFVLSQNVFGTDYTDLYDYINGDVTIDQVEEDPATGLAYLTYEGTRYELGMDFLSMAMVYNTAVPEGGRWETEDDVYATWWKYYMTRWNMLLPEIPLYSNEYYDIYNAQIKGVTEHPTNPYWGPAAAVIDWTSDKEDNSIILGNTTELSGRLRNASFGVTSPGAGDLDVENLITGLETVSTTKEGGYEVNNTVVDNLTETSNDDGSHTYTVKIKEDLVFSDGSPILAKNYLVSLFFTTGPVSVQAGGTGNGAQTMVGFEAFKAYDGTNDGVDGASKCLSGVRLLDDYTFSVTVGADYYPYFYAITYAGLSPQPIALWLGEGTDILDDGNGVYLTDNFYAKDGDTYVNAKTINDAVWDHSTDYPCSGPYYISDWDEASHTATLTRNPNFKGNYEGTKPQIEKIVYKRIIAETQLADFEAGGVDVLSGVTGGDATNEALALIEANPDKYVATHYSRAGYGKLGFRGDLGPARFPEVREAIAYCMDRATFAKDFTGGYGGVTDGAYYTGSWMYQAATADGMILNTYPTSADSAIAILEENGWCYNADGSRYTGEGVRYKKLTADQIDEKELTYASKDGTYKVEKVGDYYYMPLALNWYGTTENEFTDLLVTGFQENDNIKAAGFVVQSNFGEFNPMLDELYQGALGVSYGGVPTYNCFNFATGFTSAAYDYSWNWRIDPEWFENNSACYIKDLADAVWLK